MQRPISSEPAPLARLTFNAAAVREYFESANGLRLRVEQGVITLRGARARSGIDIIAIERRGRGAISADIGASSLTRRVLQRLFRAGLTEDQPYFLLERASRGWVGLDHLSEAQPPPRQPVMVVSDFEPPPMAIDPTIWQRFIRAVRANRQEIEADAWAATRRLVLSAQRIAKRRGRDTADKIEARKLLAAVSRNADLLAEWQQRQPEFAAEVAELLTTIGATASEAGEPNAGEPEAAVEVVVSEEFFETETTVPVEHTDLDPDTLAHDGHDTREEDQHDPNPEPPAEEAAPPTVDHGGEPELDEQGDDGTLPHAEDEANE